MIAGTSLDNIFEYIYTTKPFDYNQYLSHAGLQISQHKNQEGGDQFKMEVTIDPTTAQKAFYRAWMH